MRWHGGLLAGAAPLLVLAFVASGLANRLAFIGWGVAATGLWVAVLRRSWGWRRDVRRAVALLTLSVAFAAFGLLATRHRERLATASHACLPAVLAPVMRPQLGYWLAALAALGAAVASRRPASGGGSGPEAPG